jgi:hypothetical protein
VHSQRRGVPSNDHSKPPPELTRTPPSPENPSELRVEEPVITEPRKPKPPPEQVLVEKSSPDVLSATNSPVESPSDSLEEPQVSLPAMDVPRSIPPSEVRQLTSSKIPSSRIGRLFHYGGNPSVRDPSAEDLTSHRSSSLSRVWSSLGNPSQICIQRRIVAKWWFVDVDRIERQAAGDQADEDEGCSS